jgi:uncharacterized protein (TIGR00661 family)
MAYDFLSQIYQNTEVEVRRIPGLCFHYTVRRKLNYLKTGWYGLLNLAGFPKLIRRLQRDIESEQPDVIVTDFEPSLPYAARKFGVPFISLNHQHFLLTYDLRSLPKFLQLQAAFMAGFVKAFYRGQEHTIVSSFYFPPLRSQCQNVDQIGVLLRPEIIKATPETGNHIVAYLRRSVTPKVCEALAKCGREVRLYGLGKQPSYGSLKFFDIDVFRFIEDLATSRALISTAGNQLVGEALYLGKSVLAMPEPGNYEQQINAHFLQQSGAGLAHELEQLSAASIRSFLERFRDVHRFINKKRLYGNPAAVDIIKRYLPGATHRPAVHKPSIPTLQGVPA